MFVRCAFFKGRVAPGQEDAFHSYVEERMMPLWAAFPGALEVRVLREVETDSEGTRLPLVMAMRFPTRQAIDAALASDIRAQSREAGKGLLAMFEGEVVHTVFAMDELVAAG
jgi:antibiotic biosynthesis monooxygenase (ABM) superfamily enzyme